MSRINEWMFLFRPDSMPFYCVIVPSSELVRSVGDVDATEASVSLFTDLKPIHNAYNNHAFYVHLLHSWMWLLSFTLCSLTPYNLDPAESARTHIITFKRPFIFETWFARNFYYSGECLSIFIMVNNVRMHRFNLLHFFYAIVFAIVNKPTFNGLYLCIAYHYLTFF